MLTDLSSGWTVVRAIESLPVSVDVGEEKPVSLGTNERMVLLCLCSHADRDGGSCFPRDPRVAKETGMSVRSVRRARANLQQVGLVERSFHKTGNTFDININRINELIEGGQVGHPRSQKGGQVGHPGSEGGQVGQVGWPSWPESPYIDLPNRPTPPKAPPNTRRRRRRRDAQQEPEVLHVMPGWGDEQIERHRNVYAALKDEEQRRWDAGAENIAIVFGEIATRWLELPYERAGGDLNDEIISWQTWLPLRMFAAMSDEQTAAVHAEVGIYDETSDVYPGRIDYYEARDKVVTRLLGGFPDLWEAAERKGDRSENQK